MKKLAFFSFSILFALFVAAVSPLTARAQEQNFAPAIGVAGYPDVANGLDVATIYHKLVGLHPDFEKWARFTPEYAKTDDMAKADYIENKTKELEDHYALMSGDQSIVVQFMAELGNYSYENEGYVVRNFAEETFFPYTFAGKNYAVIPQGLMDFQFLPVSGPSQSDIEHVLASNKRRILMVLTLSPLYADKDSAPMNMAGPDGKTQSYTLISGKVANIAFYTCPRNKDCKELWENGNKEYRDDEKNELLNLKQQ